MSSEYLVMHTEAKFAKILLDGKERGMLSRVGNETFELQSKENDEHWMLTRRVDGSIRPFSIACYSSMNHGQNTQSGEPEFKIKDHIFSHRNNFYSVGGALPNDKLPQESIFHPRKYICRLVNFPFSHVDRVDEETKHRLGRHRGIAVGDIRGLGVEGFHVTLYGNELNQISLQLVAATYLLYTTR